jgi:RNA polymerase sigma-54 factor
MAHSSQSVRQKIRQLIQAEHTCRDVLSDDKLVELLQKNGIEIARRTVTKYREAMGIGSSVDRRRLFKAAGKAA